MVQLRYITNIDGAAHVVNWTNNWEAAPERYRSQAKRPL
jgi:hypothetical protein